MFFIYWLILNKKQYICNVVTCGGYNYKHKNITKALIGVEPPPRNY